MFKRKYKPSSSESSQREKGKPGLKQKLKQNQLGYRLIIGIICVIGLFLFLHFREVKIEMLQLNSTAGRYIVSQVDFEFPDEEATIIFRQDALRNIGSIYRIDGKQLREVRYQFENEVVQNQKLREEDDYEKLYQTADAFESILARSRFTDVKTIQKMKELNLSTKYYFVFVATSAEEKLLVLPQNYWRYLKGVSFEKILKEKVPETSQENIDLVISYFEQKRWPLLQDFSEQKLLHEAVGKSVPTKYTLVKTGSKIIGPEEKVSSRHITMMHSMKEALKQSHNLWAPLTIFGDLLLALVFVALSGWYLFIEHKPILRSVQKLALVVSIFLLTLIFAKLVEFILLSNASNLFDWVHFPLLVPFAALLYSVLLNSRISLYCSAFLSIILAITLAVDHNRFLIINLVTMLVVIVSAKSLRKRKEVFVVCGKCILAAIPTIFAFYFASNLLWSKVVVADMASSIIFLLFISILVMGILPVLESIFNIMTDITLMEYMDPNNELLKRLTMEIPGSYQHSLVLGNLTEAAASAIGADGLLCKVATLYHDIGKLNNPHYFTENQQSGVNIHQLLTPVESAQVIISHIKDGEILARKYRLPQSFIDIILQHHGTTLVYYFYCKEVELKGGNVDEVDESLFRYPGPKPQSKESAIIMLADTIEAASRSLDEVTEENLTEMIESAVSDKIEDGQLNECQLTFKELEIVKKTMAKTILITRHVRIKYPEKKEKI